MNWAHSHPWMTLFMFIAALSTVDTAIKAMGGAYRPRQHCHGCSCEHHDDTDV